MIDLKLLHNALILARYRNFARAAEALDMSQPALSRSISGFEAALGAQLFKRTRTGVEPTAFGERLLTRGSVLLSDASELERELALMQGLEVGLLRIGAGPYPADICVGPTLGRLASQHPNLRVEMHTSDWRTILDDVLTGRLDLAVIETSVADHHPRLRTEALPQHLAALYCRTDHPLAKKTPHVIEEVFAYPFVCPNLPARAAQIFYRMANLGAIDAETGDYLPPIRVDTLSLAKSVVLSSDAVSLAPLCLLEDELRAGRIAILPFNEPWLRTRYGFVFLKDRAMSPASHAFMATAKAVETELVEAEQLLLASRLPRPLKTGQRAV